jgi:hypothetical protein
LPSEQLFGQDYVKKTIKGQLKLNRLLKEEIAFLEFERVVEYIEPFRWQEVLKWDVK